MEAFARPLRHLADRANRFFRQPDLELLHVMTESKVRNAAIEVVMAQEYHAHNRAPFVLLDQPLTEEPEGWEVWVRSLRAQHGSRRAAMAKEGYDLPELPAMPTREDHFTNFVLQLQQILLARCEPLEGLIVVFAPTEVGDWKVWGRAMEALLGSAGIEPIRWVLVDSDSDSEDRLDRPLHALGERLREVECKVDEAEAQADMSRRLDGAAGASLDSPGLAQVGAAWPQGVTPPSKRKRPPPTPEQQAEIAERLGAPPALFDGSTRQIRPLMLRAAQALRNNDPITAIRFQNAAINIASGADMAREAMVMELVLATMFVQAEARPSAEDMYRSCAERCREQSWADLEAQALMALAALRLIDGDRNQAAVHYGEAGAVARDGKVDALAIESFRMAGQLRAEDDDRDLAFKLWTEAIAIADKMSPADAGQTSAPMAGRQLAELCRRLGLGAQATSLEEQADRMENA